MQMQEKERLTSNPMPTHPIDPPNQCLSHVQIFAQVVISGFIINSPHSGPWAAVRWMRQKDPPPLILPSSMMRAALHRKGRRQSQRCWRLLCCCCALPQPSS